MIRLGTVRAGMALVLCAAVAGLIGTGLLYTDLIAHVRGALIGGCRSRWAGCTGAGRPWRRGSAV